MFAPGKTGDELNGVGSVGGRFLIIGVVNARLGGGLLKRKTQNHYTNHF